MVDAASVSTLCNAAFVRLLGFEDEGDAIGRELRDIIHHYHPDRSSYDVADFPIYMIGDRCC